jgi:uncharacterized protein (TIGR02757 family)
MKVNKELLDSLYQKFATEKFIHSDPIQFVYKFDNPKDKEIAGFIASTLAQGKRVNIISKVNEILFSIMKGTPYDYLMTFDPNNPSQELKSFSYFAYRVINGEHLLYIFSALKNIIKKYENLKNAFYEYSRRNINSKNVREILTDFVDEFFINFTRVPLEVSSLVPNPRKGSACKRLNMFLRWMVRKDKVDTGLWNDIIPTSKLIIPLDFHVSKIAREMGLTERKQDDWTTAEEITENLKKFDPEDPVKYDLAIFGYGVSRK